MTNVDMDEQKATAFRDHDSAIGLNGQEAMEEVFIRTLNMSPEQAHAEAVERMRLLGNTSEREPPLTTPTDPRWRGAYRPLRHADVEAALHPKEPDATSPATTPGASTPPARPPPDAQAP